MIYQQVNFEDFRDAFRNYNRLDNFSYEGARVLFDYLDQLSDDTGKNYELDVIGLCCEFTEMSEDEVRAYYPIDPDDDVEDYLQDNTIVCGVFEDGGDTVYVFQQF